MAAQIKHNLSLGLVVSSDILFSTAKECYISMEQEKQAAQELSSFLHSTIGLTGQLNAVGPEGMTALQIAARQNNWTVVYVLLHAGSQVGLLDVDGLSVLHRVACIEHGLVSEETKVTLTEELIHQGADLDQTDLTGNTAIHLAAWHYNWSIVKKLLQLGANALLVDVCGYTLLHRLATISFRDFGFSDILDRESVEELARLLLKAGLNFNARIGGNEHQAMPLHIAARMEDWSTVQVFVENGADPAVLDPDGYNVLHRMSRIKFRSIHTSSLLESQLLDLVAALQKKGLDIDSQDHSGNSALDLSLDTNWLKTDITQSSICWFFLSCGAKLHPVKLSNSMKEAFLCRLAVLPRNTLSVSRLREVVENFSSECGLNQYSFKSVITRALRLALQHTNFPLAQILLESGADCGSNIIGDLALCHHGLHMKNDFFAFLDSVLCHGANPNIRLNSNTEHNFTPLHFFVRLVQFRLSRNTSIVDVSDIVRVLGKLLSYGADPLLLVHSHSLLRALLGVCWPDSSSTLVLMPILRLLIQAGVSTHQPQLSLEGQHNQMQVGAWSYLCQMRPWRHYLTCHHIPFPYLDHRELSPLRMTLNPQLAAVLIQSGACTNQELFQWKEDLSLLPENIIPKEIHSLVHTFTSNVMSLTSLARITLSHLLDCGAQRQQFLECKDIPEMIKRLVQFEDIFSVKINSL